MEPISLTFLGTGTSEGVPRLGCDCKNACTSTDPRDTRYRSSLLLSTADSDNQLCNVVIDTGPEFRLQILRARLKKIDAIFLTHDHADHIHGLDDVRPFTTPDRPMPVYSDEHTLESVKITFSYFWKKHHVGGRLPSIDLRSLGRIQQPDSMSAARVGPFNFEPVVVQHGVCPILGYKINGKIGYVTDVSSISHDSMERLRDLDILIIDALRHTEHASHFSVPEALATVRLLNPKRAYFVHMNHDIVHGRDSGLLPEGVSFAHDGLQLEVK